METSITTDSHRRKERSGHGMIGAPSTQHQLERMQDPGMGENHNKD